MYEYVTSGLSQISIMSSVVFVLNKSLNSWVHHMRRQFNVELINKMAHSVRLLVKASAVTLLRSGYGPGDWNEMRAVRWEMGDSGEYGHTFRHSSYWQVYVLNPSIKRTIKMPTKGTLYENSVRSATFIAKSPSSLSFVHISINAPKFECRVRLCDWVRVRQSSIMGISDADVIRDQLNIPTPWTSSQQLPRLVVSWRADSM